jgi:prepilin-type N-terminal cleavage/methylation domain-containing protein
MNQFKFQPSNFWYKGCCERLFKPLSQQKSRILTLRASKSAAFTLVELLVVITILGVLASIVLVNLSGGRERARDAQRKNDLRQLQTALRMYYNDFQEFPTSSADYRISHEGSQFNWGSRFSINDNVYMSTLPADPLASQRLRYWRNPSDGDLYCLWALLENDSDEQILESQSRCVSVCDQILLTVHQDDRATAPIYVVCSD